MRPISIYEACSIVEGFCVEEGPTQGEELQAWAYLIETGAAWTLQGWYGRRANEYMEMGYISSKGEILIDLELC